MEQIAIFFKKDIRNNEN
ncbi:Predicted protein [Streptococcus thermophilus LMD-9]|nr:Predicted protein [Streptococcus thermophilus LMD-9]